MTSLPQKNIQASRHSAPQLALTQVGYLLTRQWRFGFFLLFFYIIPYFLIWITQWEMPYRFAVAGFIFFLLAVFALVKRRSWHEMGFRSDTLQPALLYFGGCTLFFVVLLLIASHHQWVRTASYPVTENWLFWFYIFIVSPSQEFVYRGILFAEMRRNGILSRTWQIVISSLLFALVHIHYQDWVTIFITLGMGVVWGWLYTRYPNWWAVTLSHAILGTIALMTHIV